MKRLKRLATRSWLEIGLWGILLTAPLAGALTWGADLDASAYRVYRLARNLATGQEWGSDPTTLLRSPLYVLALDPTRNAVIVGPAEELGESTCTVTSMHYISGEVPVEPFEARAMIRYRHRAAPVIATPLPEGQLHVRFYQQQRDVTPGQYLVLYDGDVVVGGGAIERRH